MNVEKGISIPPSRFGRHRRGQCKYPFAQMDVGDSFQVGIHLGNSAKVCAANWRRRNPGWNFVSRSDGRNVRIWRVA